MEIKDEIAYKLICMSCLCFGRALQPVAEEKLKKYYLDVINEIPLCNTTVLHPNLCVDCKALLKKAVHFKQQVQDSFRILQSYTNETLNECLLTEVTRQPTLRIHNLDPISIPPTDKTVDKQDIQVVCVKDEVKNEWQQDSNLRSTSQSDEFKVIDVELETLLQTVKGKKKRKEDKEKKTLNKCVSSDLKRPKLRSTTVIEKQTNKHTDVQIVCVKDEVKNESNDDTENSDCIPSDSDDLKVSDVELETLLQTVKRKKRKRKEDKEKKILKVCPASETDPDHELTENRTKLNILPIEFENIDKHADIQICTNDRVKNEWSDKEVEDAASSDCPPSDSEEIKDIDLEALLQNVKHKKKRKEVVKKKKARVAKGVHGDNNKDLNTKRTNEQKILTIELSYEEMLLERESESKRESYLRSEYKCESCLLGFNYSKSYKKHLTLKHSPDLGVYSCPICKTVISSVESFTAHYKRHMKRYECSICQKRTQDMKVMKQHYYSTHEISLKRYKCHLCGKLSNSIDTHRYHKDTHKARVQCSECDKTFTHRAGLLNHRLAVHEFNNAFPCTVCNKVFRWKTSLKRHLEKHALEGKSITSAAFCSTCDVSFSSICSYQRHMKNSLKHVSHEQLRFICDHCNRRFADKTKLRDHIEEKHLHKTYQCHICLKPSKNRMGLDQHIRNVHRGRPNNKMCHHCGKGFPTKVQLESHIRTHTGERPFICEYCPTTFSQQSNLYKHNRQVHLNIKSKRYTNCKKKDVAESVTVQSEAYKQMGVLHYTMPDRGFIM